MSARTTLLGILALAAGACGWLSAQSTTLEAGDAVERELSTGDRHTFEVALDADQFVYGEADQQTVDVVVRVLDPDGDTVGVYDSPARGPEPFQFNTVEAGTYRIEVTPFEDEEGRYVIELLRAEPLAATPEGRVDQIMSPWDTDDRPGAAVTVVKDGEIVLSRGYGLAQLEHGVPITPTTVFHVASVSKQFTAFAVAMLADQGRLSLDDDVRTHIPELPDFGPTVTVRHLVHHTSGIRDQWALLALGGWRLDDVITHEQIMRLLSRQEELNFEPGAEYLYSNSGFTLLAEIVARVTGQSFPEWTAENVFEPLGMSDTHVHDDHERVVPGRAYSYSEGGDGFSNAVLSYANMGATSLFTTSEDLAKWELNLDRGTVGGPDVLRQVHERGVLNDGDTLAYAFGLGVDEYRGLRRVGHSGGDAGFRTYVARFPDQDFAVVVLSNLGSFNPAARAMEIADAYLEGALDPPAAAATPSGEADPSTSPWTPTGAAVASLAGYYYSPELETAYTLLADGTTLVARHQRHPDITLTPAEDEGEDAFEGDVWFFGAARFVRDEGGRATEMRVSNGRVRDLRFLRLEPPPGHLPPRSP